jgi:hypothetical protein
MAAIALGSMIHVKIVRQPTTARAAKTLERLLCKDRGLQKEVKRQSKIRKEGFRSHQRGGRPWEVRVVKQHAAEGKVGEQGTIWATADVIRDLGSVERFIEITPA